MRISREKMFYDILQVLKLRSTCNRANVSAIIVHDSRIISTGYNGSPSGWSHCTPESCNEHSPCISSIHAEVNALVHAAKHGIKIDGCTLWCSMSPCFECCKLIANSGIKKVIYLDLYRKSEHIKDFRRNFECWSYEEEISRNI